jgi:hypothetical protein
VPQLVTELPLEAECKVMLHFRAEILQLRQRCEEALDATEQASAMDVKDFHRQLTLGAKDSRLGRQALSSNLFVFLAGALEVARTLVGSILDIIGLF